MNRPYRLQNWTNSSFRGHQTAGSCAKGCHWTTSCERKIICDPVVPRTSCYLTPTKCPSQYSLDPPVTRRRSKMHSQFPWWVIVKNGGSKASNHVPMWVTPPCHSNHETFHATGATDRRSMVVQSQHRELCDKQTSTWCRVDSMVSGTKNSSSGDDCIKIPSPVLHRHIPVTWLRCIGKGRLGSMLHVVVEVQSHLSSLPNIEDASK